MLILMATSLLPSPVASQARLEAGSVIRLVVESGMSRGRAALVGTVLSVYADELTLQTSGDGLIHTVDVHQVRELYGFRPMNRRRSSLRGARVFGFLGLGVGLVAGPVIGTGRPSNQFHNTILVSTGIGFATGILAGAIAGAVTAADGWQKYQIPPEWRTPGTQTPLQTRP